MRNVLALALAGLPGLAAAAMADTLPIERGYYVQSNTPCQQASNATIMLYGGVAFGRAHAECRNAATRKLPDGAYQIMEECRDVQGGGWTPLIMNYAVASRTALVVTGPYGRFSYRYCKQSDLPDPWKTNDLSQSGVGR